MFIYVVYLFLFTLSTILQINIRNYDFLGYDNTSNIIIFNEYQQITDTYELDSLKTTNYSIIFIDILLILFTTYYIINV